MGKRIKGFTLIELLAIIMIIALIALITVPAIMNVIQTAKIGSAISSGYGLKKAVEDGLQINNMDDNEPLPTAFNIAQMNQISIKGKKPSNVNLELENGMVIGGTMTIDGIKMIVNHDGTISVLDQSDPTVFPEGYNSSTVLLGTGTLADPYQIWFLDQFLLIAENSAAYYKLMRNVDFNVDAFYLNLSNKNLWTTNTGWTELFIASPENEDAFSGVFDGNNKEIRNLYSDLLKENKYASFFGYVVGGTIKNIGFTNVNLTGEYVGTISSKSEGITIINAYAGGKIVGIEIVGGFVGADFDNYGGPVINSSLNNLYFEGKLSLTKNSSHDSLGGIIGLTLNPTIINGAGFNGNISSMNESDSIGGIVGQAFNTSVLNSYSTGEIIAAGSGLGGIAGSSHDASEFSNLSSSISIITTGNGDYYGFSCNAGGIIGEFYGEESLISNVTYNGNIVSFCGEIGGIVGFIHSGHNGTISTIEKAKSNADLIASKSYSTSNTGGIAGSSFASINNASSTGLVVGYGNTGGLVGFASSINGNDEFNISKTDTYSDVVSLEDEKAGGLIGFSLINLNDGDSKGNVMGSTAGGLIGQSNNLIENSQASGTVFGFDSDGDAGGLLGACYGWNVKISSNLSASGNVYGNANVGGLIGQTSTEFYGLSASGNVYGYAFESSGAYSGIGGLIGQTHNSVSSSYSTGNVYVYGHYGSAGGLIGQQDGGFSNKLYSTGNILVTGSAYSVGGLIGFRTGSVYNSYATGNITNNTENSSNGGLIGELYADLQNSYYTGTVSATLGDVGPVVGYGNLDEIDNVYYLNLPVSSNNEGTQLTISQMKQKNSFIDWDFDNIWKIDQNNSYPTFKNIFEVNNEIFD